MDSVFKKKLLCYLSGAALSFAAGSTALAQSELQAIPETVIMDLLDDVERDQWRPRDMVPLMDFLVEDSRPQIRSRVLEMLSSISDDELVADTEALFANLVQDEDRLVRQAIVEGLADWLDHQDVFTRLRVVSEWSVSDTLSARRAMAKVLAFNFELLGSDWLIEHLAGDSDSAVRASCAAAAESRFSENPALFSEVLQGLLSDGESSVRKAARKVLKRQSEII